jgi:hypothetical protein
MRWRRFGRSSLPRTEHHGMSESDICCILDKSSPHMEVHNVEDFVVRWNQSAAAERANFQPFVVELCDVLKVPRPNPAGRANQTDSYVFEKPVYFPNGDGTSARGYIDLYRKNCFVLEAKQGSSGLSRSSHDMPSLSRIRIGTAIRDTQSWDAAMLAARGQAERYAKALPLEDGWPLFSLSST